MKFQTSKNKMQSKTTDNPIYLKTTIFNPLVRYTRSSQAISRLHPVPAQTLPGVAPLKAKS